MPVITKSVLFNMAPNLDLISQWCKKNAVYGVYVYSNDTENHNFDYVGRNFNPLFSHLEDIATGVAAATLSFTLNSNNNKKKNFSIEQGAHLNQSNRIYISIYPEIITVKGEVYFNQ